MPSPETWAVIGLAAFQAALALAFIAVAIWGGKKLSEWAFPY